MAAPQKLVRMSDIAAKLGLSTMTVSRALRNAGSVKASTRARVLNAAKDLEYRPDPSLGILNMYRHGRRQHALGEKIAFVTDFPTADGWRKVITFARYFEGAQRRAAQLGYGIELFWIGAAGLTPSRASEILRGRGIRGIIIGPLARGRSSLALNWEYFSTVALGRSLEHPGLSVASANHFQAMELACAEVARRGYRRIGFAVTAGDEARTHGAPRAAFRMLQESLTLPLVPALVVTDFSKDAITTWAQTYQPDILLTSEQTHYDLLRAGSGRRRNPIAFVHLNVDPASDHSGVDQRHDVVGEQAAALLHLKLLQRETGVPVPREMLLVDCAWKEGKGHWALRRAR